MRLAIFFIFIFIIQNAISSILVPRDDENTKLHHLEVSKRFQDEIILNAVVPSYIHKVIESLNGGDQSILFNNVSTNCAAHVTSWMIEISKLPLGEPKLWAIHMADALAKPPEGILSGHINPMGDYDECTAVNALNLTMNPDYPDMPNSFTGKYCTTRILPISNNDITTTTTMKSILNNGKKNLRESVSPEELLSLMAILEGIFVLPSVGVCFPSTCDVGDVDNLVNNVIRILRVEDLVTAVTAYCSVKQKPDLDAGDISMIAILGVLFSLAIIAGLIDYAKNSGNKKPVMWSGPMQYLMAFSLYTNIKKWLSTRSSSDDLGCVHGIRFFSTTWVILAHTWYMVTFIPVWNMVDLKKIHEDWEILTILNSTISVDTFFVLSGLLVAYNLLKMLDKTKGKINIPMFYIHRYLRLTPTYALLLGIMATIVPYLGSGPWFFWIENWSVFCEDNWWTNLLYVNNFVHTDKLCQGEAWYLANDFQFYLISPLFIYPIWRWRKIGLSIMGFSTILSIISPALLVYYKETPPTTIGTRDLGVWFTDIYIKPWARIQTYFVGCFLGYLLYDKKGKKVHIPILVQTIAWIVATGTSLSALYGIYPYFDPLKEIPRVEGMLYAGLSRFGWGISVSWVIFACVKGYGGIVNKLLSWKVFMPLGRLTFCVFLVSLHLQMLLHLSFRQAITFEPYSMTNFFFAHLVMSFIVGFFCTLIMESPFIIIEKLIFEGPARPPRPKIEINKPDERFGIYYENPIDTVLTPPEDQFKEK